MHKGISLDKCFDLSSRETVANNQSLQSNLPAFSTEDIGKDYFDPVVVALDFVFTVYLIIYMLSLSL